MSQFLRIVKWDTLQHYKDRNPPWIKLHRDLMTSETWVSSSNDDRVLMVAIMMLAAASGNRIPANARYIQRIAYLEKEPDLSGLIGLKFIEIIAENASASKPLAPARPEGEGEKEADTLETDVSNGADAPKGPSAIDLKAAVFASGVLLLKSTGTKDRDARSMIGRWRSDHGDAVVLDALAAATAQAISQPIPWIKRRLENANGKPVSLRGARPDPALDLMRAGEAAIAAEGSGRNHADDRGTGPPLQAIGSG